MPYLRELTQSQLERGLIKYISFILLPTLPNCCHPLQPRIGLCLRTHIVVLFREEDLDRVTDFRELVKGSPIPNAQTSLSQPTESEAQMMAHEHSSVVAVKA